VKVTDVDCGTGHTCAVQDNGTVWCWGANFAHQLGLPVSADGTHIPGQVATLVDIEEVTAGDRISCASNLNGELFCWGDNDYGQVGYAPFDHVYFDIPVPYEHLSNFRSLSLQAGFAVYAVTDDGTAWGWGRYEDLYVPPLHDGYYDFTWIPIRMYDPVRD
jgi:alpha-tubulin suppressor-like RCC1 family protein